jgi:cation diffusion facilitator family transporter
MFRRGRLPGVVRAARFARTTPGRRLQQEDIVSTHDGDSTKHIIQSLLVNLVIAGAKFVAAFVTGSGAMLAEAIHSFADCGNQLLLLRGVKEAERPPDPSHPLGYGRNIYFWSFMVALLLFSGGGVFSIYEGVHHWQHPEPVENIALAVGILGFSLALEGWATWGNIKTLNERRGATPFLRFLRETKDSDLVVVFGENSAAVLGLALALVAIVLTKLTGDLRFDALGSLAVGLILVGVAVFLAVEVKSLLVGESADPHISAVAQELAIAHPKITQMLVCITVQQGPGEVFVALKVKIEKGLSGEELVAVINDYEDQLRVRCPEVQWCFVEPDFDVGKGREAAAEQRITLPTPAGV